MAINAKDLMEYSEPIRYTDGANATLSLVRECVEEKAEEYGASIRCSMDTVESGGWLNKVSTPCLLVYHPSHQSDYYNFCITRSAQGNTAVFQVWFAGKSRQMSKEQFQQSTRVFDGSGARTAGLGMLGGGAFGIGAAVGGLVGGTIRAGVKAAAKGFNALTMDKAALQQEKEWYGFIGSILNEVLFD